MHGNSDIVYRINDRDEISFVNHAYDAFAAANAGVEVASAAVLHRPLWDFIADPTTQQLYRDVLRRVREGRPLQFSFRCDSPGCRRLMKMDVSSGESGAVEFRVRTVAVENRPSQPLLEPGTARSNDLLRMCGWCKKVHVGDVWVELEEAVARLGLFEQTVLPGLTHGMCEQCYERMMVALAEF